MMTAAQTRVYLFVAAFIDREGYPPEVREIGRALGYTSPGTVQRHLDNLRALGYLEGAGRRLRAKELPLTEAVGRR